MEIGRINAILPVPRLRSSRSAPDVEGVYSIEFRKQERQETDVADEERAARGLEDEAEPDSTPEEAGTGDSPAAASPPDATISFFA